MIPPAQFVDEPLGISLLFIFTDGWRSAHLATTPLDYGLHVLAANDVLPYMDELIDYYLGIDDFTCCQLCVGLCIPVNDDDWTGYTCDHLWHFMGWFYGLSHLLTNGPRAETTTFVWDESLLKLERDHERLTLYDEHVCARAAARGETPSTWYPINVPLWDFAARLNGAGTLYMALLDQIRADLTRRGWLLEKLLPLLEGNGDMPRAAKEDTALKLAIILRETNVSLEPLLTVREMLRQGPSNQPSESSSQALERELDGL